jgi:DNA-binding MarR family transcriptional regulator/predicted GNAT family N-acyltransferase
MDYLQELGRIALGSRTKRLSDYMMAHVRNAYQERGDDLEPAMMPLLLHLQDHHTRTGQGLTLRELADHLGTSHPLISQRVKSLDAQGLVETRPNPNDERSRTVHLTFEGDRMLRSLAPTRKAILDSLDSILGEDAQHLVDIIERIERKFVARPFDQVIRQTLLDYTEHDFCILDYKDRHKKDFRLLNEQWLRKDFGVESIDEDYFSDPKGKIIDKGGVILMAELAQTAVGTCSLIPTSEGFELAKMGVAPEMRGLGIGRKLVEAAIDRARNMNLSSIFLLSSSKLEAALKLYQSAGFKPIPVSKDDQKKYGRADVKMILKL